MRIFSLLFVVCFNILAQPIISPPRIGGVSSGGGSSGTNVFSANQFTVFNGTNVFIKSGALSTNLDLIGDHPSVFRVTTMLNTPSAGEGLELGYDPLSGAANSSYITSFARGGSTYKNMHLDSAALYLDVGGNTKAFADATRFTVGANHKLGWSSSASANGAYEVGFTKDSSTNITILGGGFQLSTNTALIIQSGPNQRAGNLVLVGGTKAVANTSVTANTVVLLTRKTTGGATGAETYTISAGVGFTVNSSSGTDTSTFSYFLVENP